MAPRHKARLEEEKKVIRRWLSNCSWIGSHIPARPTTRRGGPTPSSELGTRADYGWQAAAICRIMSSMERCGATSFRDHVVICGWSDKAAGIVRQLHAPVIKDKPSIVVIDEGPVTFPDEPAFADVYSIQGDPTRDEVLAEACVAAADSAVILPDSRDGDRADARSIMIALAIESINRDVHTCVEVVDSRNVSHFERTAVNEIVSLSSVSEKLLAQAALFHGITDFYQELLTFEEANNELYRVAPPAGLVGETFADAYASLLEQRVTLIGVNAGDGPAINPPSDTVIRSGDDLWVIALSKPDFDDDKASD